MLFLNGKILDDQARLLPLEVKFLELECANREITVRLCQ